MPSTTESSTLPPRLRALDPDLPMLAARAAMELDNYKSSGEASFTAVKDLSTRLKNSFQTGGGAAAPCKALLDSSTVTLVGRALNSSRWAGSVSTIDQLSAELWDVAQRLDQVETAPSEQPIEKIRDFCIALSECAASYRQAFHELRPVSPFRRGAVQCLEYSKRRLAAFLEEIQRLKGSEFPYVHSEHALQLIEVWFSGYLGQLNKLNAGSDPATVRSACAAELTGLFEYLPVLGFILRSTNPRNAFEVHGPLLRLAREIVKPTIKLISSSEWDYSPLTYLGITHLPDYVLIGSPAHESDNPFLLPLAGHELGHSIWVTRDLSSKFGRMIDSKVVADIKKRWPEYHTVFPDVASPAILETDFFAQQTWSPAAEWGARQAEETFCDFAGLRVFGESYLHAFAYLLAPKQLWVRSVLYPNLVKRVDNLIKATTNYGVSVPSGYRNEFEDLLSPNTFDRQQTFLLSLADAASSSVSDALVAEAKTTIDASVKHAYSETEVGEILTDFYAVAPATNAGCLANILNAGWRAFHDVDLWKDIPQIQSKEKTLKELVLKSIEVFEYEQLLKVPL